MAFNVTEVQSTPNPNAAKFILDRRISDTPVSFLSPEQAAHHPIAKQLFAIDGVVSVLLLGDFVTVNKAPGTAWPQLKRRVKHVLADI
jgi:hypothetical protein